MEEIKKVDMKDSFIPTYNVEEQIENLSINMDKPSSRILQTKIGLRSLALLRKIDKEHNHSWYQEVYDRSKHDMEHTALFYRGNKITYKEMFKKADEFAKSMAKIGIKKGDEIPCCLSNTPELVYIMLAANKMGVKLNLFGTNLDEEYLKEILSNTSQKLFICSDNNYGKIKDVVETCDFDKKLLVSLADSLPENPELCDEYEKELACYYHFDNLIPEFRAKDSTITTFEDFIEFGRDYDKEIIDDNNLDTEFTVTYTSGSTRKGRPKQLLHCNRSYIVGGIYNNSNITGSPEVPEIRGLAHIHPDSNTNLVTCISDNLIKHGEVALEPEYDKDKALDYLLLNKPVHFDATTSFLVHMAKQYLIERKFHEDGKGRKFPQMLVAMAVGEKTSPGEEKFINRFLRESRAGSNISLNGIKLPYAPLSIGGGDCEHGGIYYSLLKKLTGLPKKLSLSNEEYGMVPVPFAVITALKKLEDGTYEECDYGEYGLLVANSITSMKAYKDNPEATRDKMVTDRYGRKWMSCDVYGCVNKIGNAVVKGRREDTIVLSNGQELPCFRIDDVVNRDSKNIMSCSTVKVTENGEDIPVINIEFSPFKKKSDEKVINSLIQRLEKVFKNNFEYAIRIMDDNNPFPLTGSGKRDFRALQQKGLEDTLRIVDGEIINYSQEKEVQKILRKKVK